MGVVADLKSRTGVGAGGILLYVAALAGGIVVATNRGQLHHPASALEFLTGLLYGVGLLGIVAAVSNAPRLALLSLARRRPRGEGLQAFTGTIWERAGTRTTPVSDSAAVCYTVRVLGNDVDEEPDPDDETNWSLVDTVDEGVPFSVVPADGDPVHVDPADAMVSIDETNERFVDVGESPPDRIRTVCRDADVPAPDPGGARRYQESALVPGDRAFVLGNAVEEGRFAVRDGWRFVVADEDYPDRVEGRVVTGLLGGVPVTILGYLALLYVIDGL